MVVVDQSTAQIHVEIFRRSDFVGTLDLDGDKCTLGRSSTNDYVLLDDPTVSGEHLEFRRTPTTWFVKDLDSTNGTFLNGTRLVGERRLHDRDEILVGNHHLNIHSTDIEQSTHKHDVLRQLPDISRREKAVLAALCRPIKPGDRVATPATVQEVAQELDLGEVAVRKNLSRLYKKFGIHDGDRRHKLAAEAFKHHLVPPSDLENTDVRTEDVSDSFT